jgi:hypothetical protein
MKQFFELEAGYLIIALFFIVVTYIVTTRSFMPKGALKKGMIMILPLLIAFIGFHYYTTVKRMAKVKEAFFEGKTILCENRETFKGPGSIIIRKKAGWGLKNGIFSKPNYHKKFHSARCVVDLAQ